MNERARVGCIVLAAGESRRLGRPKQLVLDRGVPLVRRAVSAALGSSCDRVALVVGAREEAVVDAVAGLAVEILRNDGWREGIASSVRVAAAWGETQRLSAIVIAVADQPRLTSDHIDALVRAHAAGAPIVASFYDGCRGVPALFDSKYTPSLQALRGDRGAGSILRVADSVHVVAWPDGSFDVDTEDDARALARIQ